jgi:superfamily II DNA or RNA helicase
MQLRPYQVQAIDDIRQAMIDGARSVLLQLPTGAGKTVIFSQITAACRDKGHRALILVHRRELIDQASRKLAALDVPHGFIAAGYKRSDEPVQIASIQTLVRRLRTVPWEPSLIIIDEAHHSLAATYRQVFEHWPGAFRIGVSATPCRLDGRGLKHAFDTLVSGPSVQQLIADGYLCQAQLWAPPIKADFTKLRAIGGDYPAGKLSERMNKPAITGDVIEHYKRYALDEKAIAFCCDTTHANAVAASFRNAGISAETLLGTTPAAQRVALVDEFAAGKVQILATVDVVSEGFDCPDAGCAILLRRTMSEALYLQQVGRVLRPAEGKPYAVVLDHVGNIGLHGFPDDDRQWTLQDRARRAQDRKPCAAVRQCPDCYAAFKPAPVCPCCGHEFPIKVRQLGHVEGELVELRREAAAERADKRDKRRQVGQARSLESLLAIARERGYAPGWAYRLHAARGGR